MQAPCHHFPQGTALIPVNAARDATVYAPAIRADRDARENPMSDAFRAAPDHRQRAMTEVLRAC